MKLEIEEFTALLALEGKYKLEVKYIRSRNHSRKGRYEARLVYTVDYNGYKQLMGTCLIAYSKSQSRAISNLAQMYYADNK